MSNIKLVSHHAFPDDPYTKELVYLEIDDRYRVAYVRKEAKTGGKFWSTPSITVTLNGEKKFFESFLQDSVFLEKDIRQFLESAPWKKQQIFAQNSSPVNSDEVPF